MPKIAGYDGFAPVGHNGRAEVFRAGLAGRWVMVEVWPVVLPDDAARRRFLRDLDQTDPLAAHPNIAPRVDAGLCSDGRPYVTMPVELLGEGTVATAVHNAGPFAVGDAVRVGVALAGAVEAAHDAGELHRGIEPASVLLPAGGGPLLTGFGLATVAELGGSLRYFAAPEQLERRTAGTAADVYSIAATLYAMLAGRAPHEPRPIDPPDSAPALLLRTLQNDVPPIDRPDVPESLAAIVRAALDRDPARRTPSVAAFGQALQHFRRAHRLHPGGPEPVVPDAVVPEAGPRKDDTLTDFWPESMALLGPTAGEATSQVWTAPVDERPPPPVVFEPVDPDPVPEPPPVPVPEPVPVPVPEPAPEPAPTPEPGPPALPSDPPPRLPPMQPPPPPPLEPPPPPPRAPVPPPRPPVLPPAIAVPREGRGARTMAAVGVAGVVILGVVRAVLLFLPEDDDPAPPPEQTTSTTEVEIPTGLTAAESPAGVQLDWEGDAGTPYAVLVMSEIATPKVLSAEAGPSLLVPMTEVAPDVGYCFAVAKLASAQATSDDLATAFSNPVCIRGASESSVQTG